MFTGRKRKKLNTNLCVEFSLLTSYLFYHLLSICVLSLRFRSKGIYGTKEFVCFMLKCCMKYFVALNSHKISARGMLNETFFEL